MAEQVVMSLDEHDRLIAYVLGLSHALNIAFFTALAESGEAAPRLARLSSTTFDAQLDVASRVAQESPDLYFEIQSLNDYGAESLEALSKAVERLRTRGAFAGSRSFCCVNAPRARLSRRPPQRDRTAGLSREHWQATGADESTLHGVRGRTAAPGRGPGRGEPQAAGPTFQS